MEYARVLDCESSASIPGLRITGFGVIEQSGSKLRYVTSGCVRSGTGELAGAPEGHPGRPRRSHRRATGPQQVAIEKVFVNVNPQSTLLLGQARGTAICAAVIAGLPVAEYTALQVKQAVVGKGHAKKEQVQHMVQKAARTARRPQPRRRRRAGLRDLPRAWGPSGQCL